MDAMKGPSTSNSLPVSYQHAIGAGLIVALTLSLTGCYPVACSYPVSVEKNTKEKNCVDLHCPPTEDMVGNKGGCTENGDGDADCCASAGTGGCRDGFVFKRGETCHTGTIVTTCCYQKGKVCEPWDESDDCDAHRDNTTKTSAEFFAEDVDESPRWYILLPGFLFGFSFCFVCCLGCALDEPVKRHFGECHVKPVCDRCCLWEIVCVNACITAGLLHGLLKPLWLSHKASDEEPGLLDLMGVLGHLLGVIAGIFMLICLKPWLSNKVAAYVQGSPVASNQVAPVAVVGTPVSPAVKGTAADPTSSQDDPTNATN